jgi:hypothetical protein
MACQEDNQEEIFIGKKVSKLPSIRKSPMIGSNNFVFPERHKGSKHKRNML